MMGILETEALEKILAEERQKHWMQIDYGTIWHEMLNFLRSASSSENMPFPRRFAYHTAYINMLAIEFGELKKWEAKQEGPT